MTDRSPLFGSYGVRSALLLFGKRNNGAQTPVGGVAEAVFGKRAQQPGRGVSLQEARLSLLCSELLVLFEDKAFPKDALPFVLELDREVPRLLVANSAVVTIDGETGYLVFNEVATHAGLIVVTASEERLIDHVVCHLAASGHASGKETANKAAEMLVGRTLADVERRLIFQTLRHCHGNRTRTAALLGISLRTIRNKLRGYWQSAEAEGEQS
ncbi:helix-turn-helix domain-containing protein [Agrobacterium tumefaciens]|uniref:helix-turn-helix domain-containing protein n=1 Tax=Agrobacterium tumefaciens TaxID=358 RepID=UPI001CC02F6C|nr:helix-turn-helix domain-containing protein [Agrobacterium tumefaciens]